METLKNDMVLNAYPGGVVISCDQIAAGKKAFKNYWNYSPVRIIFNILLPFIMLFTDFYLPIKYLLMYLFHKKSEFEGKRMFVGHDRRLYTISNKCNIVKPDDVWLRLLSDHYTIPKDKIVASILDYVTPIQILKSGIQAFILHLYTTFSLGYNMYFLSFKAFEWCVTDYALRNVSVDVELIYSYICDRYAIMLDKLPHMKKTLIQHGTMHFGNKTVDIPYYEFHPEKGFYIWKDLYRSSPTTVYCYTDTDEWALSNSVIKNKPHYIHIGYGFKPTFHPIRKSVLIVSNYYIFANKEECIIKQLQKLNIDIYLKNHPSHANSLYDEMRKKYNFIFIKGLDTDLPAVDIVISYDSTLAYEYASIGTKVLYYGHFDINDIARIVSEQLSLN